MILNIQRSDLERLHELWLLQHTSYRMEAELIGFDKIPPLLETLDSLRNSEERFLGYYDQDHSLAGAISYNKTDESVTICRMMVHPDCFRQGIATRLLQRVEELEPDSNTFEVSTGLNNEPAVKLYEKNGYIQLGTEEVAPGVQLSTFIKRR